MSERNSKRSRGSSRRKRQSSSKSAGSTWTNGSMASSFFDLMRSANFCSKTPTMSAGVITGPWSLVISPWPLVIRHWRMTNDQGLMTKDELSFSRRGPFLGLDHEGQCLFGVGQFRGELDVAGARGNAHVDRLVFREVAHALDLVLNAHQAFEKCFGTR